MKRIVIVIGAVGIAMGIGFYFGYRDFVTPAPQQTYPESMGSISCERLIEERSDLPEQLKKEVDQWVRKNRGLLKTVLSLPHFATAQEMKTHIKNVREQIKDLNLSKNNYIFDIQSSTTPAVIKIAGFPSRISSRVSSLGFDPHKVKWWRNDPILSLATKKSIPTQQHITRAATQHLLKKVDWENLQVLPTYLYHIPGRPKTCDDTNYLIVQEKLEGFTPFEKLSLEDKKEALVKMDLQKLYEALKYANLWDMSERNLWINKDNVIAYPDGEKPGNEGHGNYARWKVAVLGHDLEKAKYNVRNWYDGGHRAFERILKNYLPERIPEWMQLYEQDETVHLK